MSNASVAYYSFIFVHTILCCLCDHIAVNIKMAKISKYMKDMKSYLLPSVAKMLVLPKKDPSLQSLIDQARDELESPSRPMNSFTSNPTVTQARDELEKILKDPVYSSNEFENAKRSINVWFEGYIERCGKNLKDVKVREEFKEFVLFM